MDLGVMVDNELNMISKCDTVVKKANVILGYISRGISRRSKEVLLPVYTALVSLLLEYCVHFRCLLFKKDVDKLESIQERATKII